MPHPAGPAAHAVPALSDPTPTLGAVTTLYSALVVLHLLFMALLIGGYAVAATQGGTANVVMSWGARLQLLTGVALMGVAIANDQEVDHMLLGIKLLVALVVVVLIEIGFAKQKRGEPRPAMIHAAGVLALVNFVIGAVLL